MLGKLDFEGTKLPDIVSPDGKAILSYNVRGVQLLIGAQTTCYLHGVSRQPNYKRLIFTKYFA